MTKQSRRPIMAAMRMALRIAFVFGLVYLAHVAMNWLLDQAGEFPSDSQKLMINTVLLAMLAVYALLMAIPFVPGVEIGISLLMLRGAQIAPFVYIATVIGLSASFLIGYYISARWLQKTLLDLRLLRAAQLLERLSAMPVEQRVQMLRDRLPGRLGRWLIAWRYLAVAILFNIPGNSVIGGGGGISLIAGMSQVFSPRAFILTILIAVSPIPVMVIFFGTDLFAAN